MLLDLFMPRTVDYVNHVEMEMIAHLRHDLAIETWDPPQDGYAEYFCSESRKCLYLFLYADGQVWQPLKTCFRDWSLCRRSSLTCSGQSEIFGNILK